MSNKEVAACLDLLAELMKLHGEEDFRVRSYEFASRSVKNADQPVINLTSTELKKIKGVGDAIAQRIIELARTGQIKMLDGYIEKTPRGILELLKIKGLGPGKIRTLWFELGIESPGELLYACGENRLTLLKGFGEKTQETIRQQVEFQLRSQGQYRWASVELFVQELTAALLKIDGVEAVHPTGEFRRCLPVVNGVDLLVVTQGPLPASFAGLDMIDQLESGARYQSEGSPVVTLYAATPENTALRLLQTTGPDTFVTSLNLTTPADYAGKSEAEILATAGLAYVVPEFREDVNHIQERYHGLKALPELITEQDIKGVIHSHSTWSDGAHTLEQMAEAAKKAGFGYLVITDHSKTAFYANGLQPERIIQQWAEIDQLNQRMGDFRVFKGIESDILYDGALDYDDDMLAGFDCVIASVHSVLRMDIEKATTRLIKAIENPYTKILGHPTGRLLLSREGYPIDHRRVIDACADNGVAIELNANPARLDLDWRWIPYAIEKGVYVAINPDAHSTEGISHIRYGTMTARKGGLTARHCLNAMSAAEFGSWLKG